MVTVLIDVALTTMHPDVEGIIVRSVQRGIWALAIRSPGGRGGRRILALAGPVMIAATFVVWVVVFILGFALVVWPFLDGAYRVEPEITQLGFAEALYYSGVTVTVLGYGDITPLTVTMQMLTLIASASGFALVTGIVTYVIQLVSSLNARIHLAVRLDDDTEGSGDGVGLLLTSLNEETLLDTRNRIEQMSDMVREANDRLHRLPMVGLFYRSADPARDPEPALKVALETAVAARLVSLDQRYVRLGPAARSLNRACQRMVSDMAGQYLNADVQAELRQPKPDESTKSTLTDIRSRLSERAGVAIADKTVPADILATTYRMQRFLRGLDDLTRWKSHRSY